MMILIGLLLPPLMGFITRTIKDSDGRFWVSITICVVIGILYDVVLHNGWSGYTGLTLAEIAGSWAEAAMMMVGTAKVSYEAFWNNQTVGKAWTDEKTLMKAMDLKPANN